jgi:SAM-dependent methyltransferase
MAEEKSYDKGFFNELSEGSYRSAKNMVPKILELTTPKSVIDIGCGLGAWLKVFNENGIEDFLGIDGEYVNTSKLLINADKFKKHDLKKPIDVSKKFDLCISLEVAEHLPESVAEQFVDDLIKLSDVVLFSAAIPMQLGTYHINEQYPEYWANIFAKKGYIASDCIRPFFWNDKNINYWFKQNPLIYVKKERLNDYPLVKEFADKTNKDYLTKMHPDILEHKRFFRWAHFTLYTFSKLTGINFVKTNY